MKKLLAALLILACGSAFAQDAAKEKEVAMNAVLKCYLGAIEKFSSKRGTVIRDSVSLLNHPYPEETISGYKTFGSFKDADGLHLFECFVTRKAVIEALRQLN